MDDAQIRTMWMMAWSRAKGELDAMLCSYWGSDETFKEMQIQITNFVKEVEDQGLQE